MGDSLDGLQDASQGSRTRFTILTGKQIPGALRRRFQEGPFSAERLVKTAFDQIRQAAAENPAVLIRILDTIRRMTPRMRTEDARQALMAQADAVREAASTKVLVKLDRDDVEAAWRRARPAAEASSVSA